jgi:hypothetical protein
MTSADRLADEIDTIILSNPWSRDDAVAEITGIVRSTTADAIADRDAALEVITILASGSVDEAMLATLARKSKALIAQVQESSVPVVDHGYHVGDIVTPELDDRTTARNFVVVHPDSMTTHGDKRRTLPVRVSTAGETRWVDPETVSLTLSSISQADSERTNAIIMNKHEMASQVDRLRLLRADSARLHAVPEGVPLNRAQLDVLYPDHLSLFSRPVPDVQF